MPTTYKVLGQVAPSANTNSTVYTVPGGAQTVISTISVCNQDVFNRSFNIAVVPSTNSISSKHYIAYKTPIANLDSIVLTMGITLGANDSLIVYSENTANISFSVFGMEITL